MSYFIIRFSLNKIIKIIGILIKLIKLLKIINILSLINFFSVKKQNLKWNLKITRLVENK